MRPALLILLLALALEQGAHAQSGSCPLPQQTPTLVIELFFGQRIPGGGAVTSKEWRSFLARTVTPRFPDGFTVYDAYGQWRQPGTRSITRERSKVVVIVAADTPEVRAGIAQVTAEYRTLFHQHSVGVVTSPGCAAF